MSSQYNMQLKDYEKEIDNLLVSILLLPEVTNNDKNIKQSSIKHLEDVMRSYRVEIRIADASEVPSLKEKYKNYKKEFEKISPPNLNYFSLSEEQVFKQLEENNNRIEDSLQKAKDIRDDIYRNQEIEQRSISYRIKNFLHNVIDFF